MSTEVVENLIKESESIINKVDLPDRHTFYQLQKFVFGKEPTVQAQLWQIVREIQARLETIDSYKKQLQDAEDNLELFDIKIERVNIALRKSASDEVKDEYSSLNLREMEINISKLQRDKESLILSSRKVNKKLKSTLEELAFLHSAYQSIVKTHGEIKPLDDNEAQKEFWNEKLLEEFNLRVILKRPLEPELVKTILSLDDDSIVKKHVVKMIENIQKEMIAKIETERPNVEVKAKVQA